MISPERLGQQAGDWSTRLPTSTHQHSEQGITAEVPDFREVASKLREGLHELPISMEAPCEDAVVVTLAQLIDQGVCVRPMRIDRCCHDLCDAQVAAAVDSRQGFASIEMQLFYGNDDADHFHSLRCALCSLGGVRRCRDVDDGMIVAQIITIR